MSFPLPLKWRTIHRESSQGLQAAFYDDELELIGFPQTMSWFELLQRPVNGVIRASDMINCVGRRVQMAGLLVTVKYVRTVKREIMPGEVHGAELITFLKITPFRAMASRKGVVSRWYP